jgi:GNAT superfamily N-acetyltransferase
MRSPETRTYRRWILVAFGGIMTLPITYRRRLDQIDWMALAAVFQRAGLGSPTPADLQRAYTNSALYVFAYAHDDLIGAARVISDGVYHAELCDTVVLPEMQRQGIGRQMVEILLHDLNGLKVLLTASFGKEEFYRKLGFRRHKTALAYNYGAWWYDE